MNVKDLMENLDACRLGKASTWYTEEISKNTRTGIRKSDDGIEDWCIALETRFRDSPGKALAALESCRYTTEDVARGKDPEEYVQRIIIHGNNAGTTITKATQARF